MKGELDPVIHPSHRLRICAMLEAGRTVELAVVKTHLDVSPSSLSKQVAALVEVGYVLQERSGSDSRRVWLSLTETGRAAYRAHVEALRAIVAGVTDDPPRGAEEASAS